MATRNITGNVGDLTLPGGPTWTPAVSDTTNVFGVTAGTLEVHARTHDAVNLERGSMFIGGVNVSAMGHTELDIVGRGVWNNNTTSHMIGQIGADVVGVGTIIANTTKFGGGLTFLHGTSVGAGQTVSINGSTVGYLHGKVEVQSPSLFHAAVQLGYGELDLDGLHGTSYSLKNDLLSIYNGQRVVDVVRLTSTQHFAPLVVSQASGYISIHPNGNGTGPNYNVGVALPMHG